MPLVIPTENNLEKCNEQNVQVFVLRIGVRFLNSFSAAKISCVAVP